ncbi:LysR substrate-binding domain-containing protein [Bradyrhizobium arachidis]|uniref:LysR family transcriptional regulator n=1 Tax=Bradyrhizobium arachidis TaxID=858423 RepID=A0AAE7TG11_9BRAD|nr:LysR substrate-binding domain-containing protein [Bradyrhizobium arachidis]QOZ67373.1 LysR family transcriptional regulator [Bradyrhizobium arachidis]SFU80679.1 LysR family transcriptional regulator, glycine cleavage system transcriptional activator [Bradyrhizobium arachidis]
MATSRKLPSLAAIRAFEVAARQGSFTRAAEELGTTQSSISHHVKTLEDQIGHALFVRRNRFIELTPVGIELAPVLHRMFDSMAEAFAHLDAKRRTVLSVTALTSLAPGWILPRLDGFRRRHPDIEVRFETSREIVDLERHGFDVGLRSGGGVWPGLRIHKLLPFALTPLCSPAFVKQFGPLKSPHDLLRVPMIQKSDPYWPSWFARSGMPNVDLPTKAELSLDCRNLCAEAALRGHGVALLSPALYAHEIQEGRLVQPFPIVTDMTPRAYWLVYPVNRSRFPAVQAFRRWMTKPVQGEQDV